MKWWLTTLVALVLFAKIIPGLSRYGFGRLPGDFNLRFRGRVWSFPVTSSLLLASLLGCAVRWL